MQTWAIVTARMGSTRLPGKSMADICGRSSLDWICSRAQASERVAGVVVATSDEPSDAPIRRWAASAGRPCHAGPLEDVLTRTAQAAAAVAAEEIVFLNGDSPLTDPAIIDIVLAARAAAAVDYASSLHGGGGYPDGFSVEAFSRDGLERVVRDAAGDPAAREHVTLPFYRSGTYTVTTVSPPAPPPVNLHLSLDTAADLALIRDLYAGLIDRRPSFGYAEVMRRLHDDPALLARATQR